MGNDTEEKNNTHDKTGCTRTGFCTVANIVCCFFLAATGTFGYIFANVTPYVTSYLRNVTHSDLGYTDTLWLELSAEVINCITMPFIGMLSTKIPVSVFLMLGIISSAGFLFGTWWTVRISLWTTLMTFGIIGGLCRPTLYLLPLNVGAKWAPRRKGFVSGIILMGYGIGTLAWNPLTTWYINPDNLDPDLKVGEDRYYTQKAVLDKVPTMFMWVGVLFTSIQLICLAIIRNPPSPNTETVISVDIQESEPLLKRTSGGHSYRKNEDVDYTWHRVLRSRAFWTLWFIVIFTGFGVAIIVPLFKAYGQTFIKDDHFLTVVATLSAVANAVGRPCWGLLADRVGHRPILLLNQFCLAILVVTFSSCEETGRATYLMWVCAMFLCISGYYTMLPVLILSLFGTANFNVNLGCLGTSGVFGSLLPALTSTPVKAAFGWNGLFFVGFAGIFTGTFLNLSLEWFRCGDSIPEEMHPKLSIRRRGPNNIRNQRLSIDECN